jgi:hypothetical protein
VRSSTGSDPSENQDLCGPAQMKIVDKIVKYVRNNFGGISRKYLQNYISMYWCQAVKRKRKGDWLLNLCLRFRSISRREIRDYVSPLLVQIMMSKA